MQKAIENNKEKRIAMKGRGKRKIKNFMISLLALTMVVTTLQSSAWAGDNKPDYSTESSLRDNTGIQDLKSYFTRAEEKNKKHTQKSVTIAATIPSTYKQNIFHYECPESGYYAIYATPGIDTVGALFEEQNYLFKPTEYELRAHNDDQFKGFGTFGIVARLDKNEDYYACVRGYGKTTGAYNLVIEPNEDKVPLPWKTFGTWDVSYHHAGDYAFQKVYLTKEQAILYSMALDGMNISMSDGKQSYTMAQLKQKFASGDSTTVVNFLATVVAASIGVAASSMPALGVTVSFVAWMFTEGLSAENANTASAMREKIKQLCGIRYYVVAGQGITTRWEAARGFVLVKRREWHRTAIDRGIWVDMQYYEPYMPGSDTMKGEKWSVGTWTFN